MTIDPDELRHLYATDSLGSPDHAVGFVLWRVVHRYQRAAERVLKPHGLTHLQFTTLAMVGWMCRSAEAATQAELAREADIHPMQISLMLKALETKGLIQRPRSSQDTRTRRVELTAAGLDALRTAFPIIIALQKTMFGAAGAPGGALLRALRDVETRNE
jgi:DNA-binding MarR family transcriptional regulator